MNPLRKFLFGLWLLLAAMDAAHAANPDGVQVVDQDWVDSARNRTVPVRLRVPAGGGPFPVILFSHGLGGSRAGGAMWGEDWAKHGYLVIHMQHAGSDEAIWREQGALRAMSNARSAMSVKNANLRTGDVGFVLDELARRRAMGDPLVARADLQRIGLSGHSFGAQTTLAVAGEKGPYSGDRADPRVRAAIALSPATWGTEGGMTERYAGIRIPFMSLTGTEDKVPLTPQITPENRTLPYKYMQSPDKYLLVLNGANHMVYNGQPELRRSWSEQNLTVHAPLIKEGTLAFWNAYLKGDATARASLALGGAFSQHVAGKGEWSVK